MFATKLRDSIRISIPGLAERLEGILNVYSVHSAAISRLSNLAAQVCVIRFLPVVGVYSTMFCS